MVKTARAKYSLNVFGQVGNSRALSFTLICNSIGSRRNARKTGAIIVLLKLIMSGFVCRQGGRVGDAG